MATTESGGEERHVVERAATVPHAQPPGLVIHPVRKWLRVAAVLLGLAGWWVSIDLLLITGGAAASNPLLQAQCGERQVPESTFDCLGVLRSNRARIGAAAGNGAGMGLPWAAVGAAYFAFVTLWYLFVGPVSRDRWLWHVPIALVVVLSAMVSIDLVRVMATELRQWCAGCLATHFINAGLLLITVLIYPWGRSGVVGRRPSTALGVATLCAGFCAGLLHLTYTQLALLASSYGQVEKAYREIVEDPAFTQWRYLRQPVVEIPPIEGEPMEGVPNASHGLVVFMDFECPACRLAHEQVASVLERFPGRLRVRFRHFPQDPACNPLYEKRGGHRAACQAARAAEAARVVGGHEAFHTMRNLLYERRNDLELSRFRAWAEELRMDGDAFAAAMKSLETEARIASDIELGIRLGLSSMPALFLDGRRLEHWRQMSTWEALLGEPAAPVPESEGR